MLTALPCPISHFMWSASSCRAAVKDAGWSRTPIDRFVLAALEKKGLAAVAEADRHKHERREAERAGAAVVDR